MPRDNHAFAPDEREMIQTFANLAASALERAEISEVAEKTKVEADGEKLRNALLSAVSHDFRTPLASIKGVISSLLMDDNRLHPDDKKELLASAHGEVARLERIVSNLLEVTLLESGKLKLKKDYYFLPELVGNALKQTEAALQGRPSAMPYPAGLAGAAGRWPAHRAGTGQSARKCREIYTCWFAHYPSLRWLWWAGENHDRRCRPRHSGVGEEEKYLMLSILPHNANPQRQRPGACYLPRHFAGAWRQH